MRTVLHIHSVDAHFNISLEITHLNLGCLGIRFCFQLLFVTLIFIMFTYFSKMKKILPKDKYNNLILMCLLCKCEV